ncbi:hypothetical protein BSK43_001430 [Rhizobium sp. P44RR-XXIV]|uniref:ProQ/FINO family protein n=1 Tax=Rhizobium sp. AC27/96 TaxID=1841653 RepID=UPI0009860C00|nr:hypothetical protein BSK43_001430 [Rhizobium sp. P44RR-XXIV]
MPNDSGLFEDLKSRLNPRVGTTVLRRAVAAYVHSKRYYFASAQPNAMRYDLEGEWLSRSLQLTECWRRSAL